MTLQRSGAAEELARHPRHLLLPRRAAGPRAVGISLGLPGGFAHTVPPPLPGRQLGAAAAGEEQHLVSPTARLGGRGAPDLV